MGRGQGRGPEASSSAPHVRPQAEFLKEVAASRHLQQGPSPGLWPSRARARAGLTGKGLEPLRRSCGQTPTLREQGGDSSELDRWQGTMVSIRGMESGRTRWTAIRAPPGPARGTAHAAGTLAPHAPTPALSHVCLWLLHALQCDCYFSSDMSPTPNSDQEHRLSAALFSRPSGTLTRPSLFPQAPSHRRAREALKPAGPHGPAPLAHPGQKGASRPVPGGSPHGHRPSL